jgi:hypothetical protein
MTQRWYDRDPALSGAMEQLRNAADKYQAQIALNIINIVVEHLIEEASDSPLSDNGIGNLQLLYDQVGIKPSQSSQAHSANTRRRWYDVNETLRSAMQLLQDCPDELQQKIIPSIATMIDQTLQNYLAPVTE